MLNNEWLDLLVANLKAEWDVVATYRFQEEKTILTLRDENDQETGTIEMSDAGICNSQRMVYVGSIIVQARVDAVTAVIVAV